MDSRMTTACRQWLVLMTMFVSLLTSGVARDEDFNGPCLGCRLFNIEHEYLDKDKKDQGLCHYPCKCPYKQLECHPGVSIIKDGCGCCYMCARQLGDMCSIKDKCDVDKNLYCSNKNENSTGVCKGREKRACHVKGAVYQDGEKFQVDCEKLCTCQNGFYGCVNLCPQEHVKPSEMTCHDPKLIKIKGKCCREWTCQKLDHSGHSLSSARGLESQNLIAQNPLWYRTSSQPPTTLKPLPKYGSPGSCTSQDTDWSPCSVTCGVGVSVRIMVDTATCNHFQERQLCFLRPCGVQLATMGRDKCTPTTRTKRRQHIYFQDCVSMKNYNLKFCTTCQTDKCCYPKKTRTKRMEFQCTGGKNQIMKFMWIRKCNCSAVCYKKDKRRKGKDRKKMKERRREKRKRRRRRRRERRKQRNALKKKNV